jgi:hypothetical protein
MRNLFSKSLFSQAERQQQLAIDQIEQLEDRILLTTFFVDTLTDSADDAAGVANGQLSLREAIVAAQTDAAFGDAHAGDAAGDVIKFRKKIAGQTIVLEQGELSISDNLQIIGRGRDIRISANGNSRVFNIQSQQAVKIYDLTIANGYTDGAGGAIHIASTSVTKLSNVFVSQSEAAGSGGGAIAITAGSVKILSSTISENNASGDAGVGGGIYLASDQAHLVISGSTIQSNVASSSGGGIWNQTGSTTVLRKGSLIADNSALGSEPTDGGGGVYNDQGALKIIDSTIKANGADGSSGSGGGLYSNRGQIKINRSTISSNTAVRAGGGIEVVDGLVRISDSTLGGEPGSGNIADGNPANPGSGGALHTSGSDGSRVFVTDSKIENNYAALEGGGFWIDDNSLLILTRVTALGNVAAGDAADTGGGAIYNDGGLIKVFASSLIGNFAVGVSGSGGAILSSDGVLRMVDSQVAGNSANRAGGGLELINGSAFLTNTTLGGEDEADGNLAGIVDEAGNPGAGGGLHTTDAVRVILRGSVVRRNLAALEGGGIWLSDGSALLTYDSLIADNQAYGDAADSGGAGIYNDGGLTLATRTTISNNYSQGTDATGAGVFNKGLFRGKESIIEMNANASLASGGGIFTAADGFTILSGSVVDANAPDDLGGPGKVKIR